MDSSYSSEYSSAHEDLDMSGIMEFDKKGLSEYTFEEEIHGKYKRASTGKKKHFDTKLKIFTIVFLVFVISDFFLSDIYFNSSCKVTELIQKAKFLELVSTIFSGPLTFWTIIYLLFFLPVSPFGYIKTTYYLMIFLAQLWLMSWMKPTYGRSRPNLQCEAVKNWSCVCDYGMPSGHSSIGCMNGYILGDFILIHLKQREAKKNDGLTHLQVEAKYKWVRILSWCIGVAIALSRIVLGVHSWNQVVIGFGMSLLILNWITEQVWRAFILRVGVSTRSGKNTFLYIGLAIMAISALVFKIVYSITEERETPTKNPPKWERCPECNKSFK